MSCRRVSIHHWHIYIQDHKLKIFRVFDKKVDGLLSITCDFKIIWRLVASIRPIDLLELLFYLLKINREDRLDTHLLKYVILGDEDLGWTPVEADLRILGRVAMTAMGLRRSRLGCGVGWLVLGFHIFKSEIKIFSTEINDFLRPDTPLSPPINNQCVGESMK